jgi:thymidylate kinase
MNYLLIIEGPDNIGKSTLIKNIQEIYFDIKIKHFGPPITTDPYNEYKKICFDELDLLAKMTNDNVFMIWDRSPFGEYVYAKQRGYEMDYLHDVCNMLSNIKNLKVMFVLMYGNAITLEKFNIPSKKDEVLTYQKKEKINKIAADFLELTFQMNAIYKIIIDSNKYKTLDDRNKFVIYFVRTWDIHEYLKSLKLLKGE